MNYEKVFKQMYTCYKTMNFELFKEWTIARKITKKHTYSSYEHLKPNGRRGLRRYNWDDWIMRDHTTSWQTSEQWDTGLYNKIIVCHPYGFYPKWHELYEENKWQKEVEHRGQNIQRLYEETQENIDNLIKWGNKRDLDIIFYKSSKSWYYPNNTIMYEIEHKANTYERS